MTASTPTVPVSKTRSATVEAARPAARVVVNARAGTVLQAGRQAFGDAIVAEFASNGWNAEVTFAKGPDLRRVLQEALNSPADLVVLAGGDGTVSHLLQDLISASRPSGILPLGTLNLLARDLGLTGDLAHDIAALTSGGRAQIDVARVNGQPFHSNAGLGFFSMMARERELARTRFPFSKAIGFAWAALRTVLLSRPIQVEIDMGDSRAIVRADAVLVTNNRFQGTPWKRDRLDEGVIEVHLLQAPTLPSRIRAAIAVARGTWRDLPTLTSYVGREFIIHRRARRRSWVAIDGELLRIASPMRYTVEPRAMTIAAPGAADHA